MCSRCATRGRKPKADRPESHGPRNQARQRSSTARLAGRHRELNSIFVLLDQAVPRCSPLQKTELLRSGRFMTHEAPAARQWSVEPCLRSPQPQFHLRALWSFALRCFPTCGAGPGLPYMVKVLKVTRLVQVTRGLGSLLFWHGGLVLGPRLSSAGLAHTRTSPPQPESESESKDLPECKDRETP